MPGLIDAHVHLVHVLNFARVTADEILPLYLAAGVTSVRSTGDEIVAATLISRIAARHPESSPRVFNCGPLLDGEPPIHRDVGRGVSEPGQVPAIVEDLLQWKVRTLNLYAGTGRAVGQAIIGEGIVAGSIAVGKLADLLLLTRNPLDDIRNTRSIRLVIRGGHICYPGELLQLVPQE